MSGTAPLGLRPRLTPISAGATSAVTSRYGSCVSCDSGASKKAKRGADAVAGSEQAIASTYPNTSVVVTEPVADYLLQASGLVNRTPRAFTSANENGTDPSPADTAYVLNLVKRRQVASLLVNPQTSTPAINGLQDAARRAGVPVTQVTETLPNGTDYLTWQRNTVNQLLAALQSNRTHAAS